MLVNLPSYRKKDYLEASATSLQFYRDVIATHLGSFMLGNNEQAHLEFKSKSKEELGNFLEDLINGGATAFSVRIVENALAADKSVEDLKIPTPGEMTLELFCVMGAMHAELPFISC